MLAIAGAQRCLIDVLPPPEVIDLHWWVKVVQMPTAPA